MEQGFFITLEGTDGSGKSTQMKYLKTFFEQRGFDVVLTREPGGTKISEKIRELILDNENTEMTEKSEALLYAAARAQHVAEVIVPALREGKVVLCDRFVDSSIVYQGGGRDIGTQSIENINDFATGGLRPNLTLWFDLPPEEGLKRVASSGNADRLEKEKIQFHQKVYQGYRELKRKYPQRIKAVDGSQSIEKMRREIEGIVIEKLKEVYGMKLVIAIVNDEDANKLLDRLTENRHRVTKLATTGGFLKAGNTTFLIGTEDDKVDQVMGIIKEKCETRKQVATSPAPVSGTTGVYVPHPIEVNVGGATVFVVDVEKHFKI
jgi:dTMP kinase